MANLNAFYANLRIIISVIVLVVVGAYWVLPKTVNLL